MLVGKRTHTSISHVSICLYDAEEILDLKECILHIIRSCHHGMARPQDPDGGTPCNMEGCCEYIEQAAADIRQWSNLQLGGCATS